MTNKSVVKRGSDIKAVDDAVRSLYPDKNPEEIRAIRAKILSYVADGLSAGCDIALIKEGDGHTNLRILKLIDKPRNGRLLESGNAKDGE